MTMEKSALKKKKQKLLQIKNRKNKEKLISKITI